MAKGAQFERDISRQLSLWWTNGDRDDVFWRTSMSGGRATVRRKKGIQTAYQHGDITATDPIGAPLLADVVIELKRGYKKWCVLDMVDGRTPDKTTFAQFLAQVNAECSASHAKFFMLICKRDGKLPIIAIPTSLAHNIFMAAPSLKEASIKVWEKCVIMRLSIFLEQVSPQLFMATINTCKPFGEETTHEHR